MIITVQGTKKRKNNSAGMTALLASMTSILYNAKTLVLQLSNPKELSVEECLLKERKVNELISSKYFNTSGVDSILLDCVDTKELKKGYIAEKSNTFITIDGEPLLTVTPASGNKSFEEVAMDDLSTLDTLLESANKEYEYVFILMPRKVSFASYIMSKATYNIICIPQNERAEVLSFDAKSVAELPSAIEQSKKKDIYLITDYDEGSRFTQKKIRTDYNIKKTFVAYHNVDYKDAFNSNDVLNFVKKNIDVDSPYDTNYMFISELKRLIAEYALEELDEHYDDLTFVADSLQETPKKEKSNIKALRDVNEFTISFEEVTKKNKTEINTLVIGTTKRSPLTAVKKEEPVEKKTPVKKILKAKTVKEAPVKAEEKKTEEKKASTPAKKPTVVKKTPAKKEVSKEAPKEAPKEVKKPQKAKTTSTSTSSVKKVEKPVSKKAEEKTPAKKETKATTKKETAEKPQKAKTTKTEKATKKKGA